MKIFMTVFTLFAGSLILSCGNNDTGNKPATNAVTVPMTGSNMMHNSTVTNMDALICPVSGDKIAPGQGVKYQQNGYEFTLCCPACVNAIQKDFEKYKAKGKKL
jgi:hypothetical protein